jgi:DNA-binding NarL/FixJ family response regulator
MAAEPQSTGRPKSAKLGRTSLAPTDAARIVPAGPARAKKHGTRSGNPIGRPRNSSDRTASQVLKLRRQGWGLLRIGRELKIGTGTVQRILAERG